MKYEYKSRRKFGSSRYFLSGLAEPLTKNEAINEAKRIRNNGGKSRVIKVKNGYFVYGR